MTIDAKGVYYRQLNEKVREAIAGGDTEIILNNVNGQRYIADGLRAKATITINGVPGNDLAAFMDGPTLIINGNAQDGVANTMNDGKIVVKGNAGDVLGYGMRGGKLYVKGDVGYRVGIHMKGFKDQIPVIVAGGTAGDFFGEYMAGGILVLLGIGREKGAPIAGGYLGTGMHGGVMYIRGEVDLARCGAEVGILELDDDDNATLEKYLKEFCEDTGHDMKRVMKEKFVKLYPKSSRPYGRLYAY
jgi:glutamate synthase domain-containing protein 3